jgi:hypothetical protein
VDSAPVLAATDEFMPHAVVVVMAVGVVVVRRNGDKQQATSRGFLQPPHFAKSRAEPRFVLFQIYQGAGLTD